MRLSHQQTRGKQQATASVARAMLLTATRSHYGRGHYTSTEPAYATLYSAAFGGGRTDNVLDLPT